MKSRAKAMGPTAMKGRSSSAKKGLETRVSALSEEFVRDSDSDEANGATYEIEVNGSPKKRRKLQDSRLITSASPKPLDGSTIKPTMPGAVKGRVTPDAFTNGEDSSSDESQEEDSETGESGDEEEYLRSGNRVEDATKGKQGCRKEDEDHSRSESHDEGSREGQEGSEEDSEEGIDNSDQEDLTASQGTINQKQQRTKLNIESTHQPELKPYKPPPGFDAQLFSVSSSELASLYSPLALAGKQIWYITAPASIPFDSIKEVNPESISNGKAVLSYKNADYGFTIRENDIEIRERLLLPNYKDSSYHSTNSGITRSIHLRQLVRLPGTLGSQAAISSDSFPPGNATKVYKKAVRQQPEGLRMRYQPFGDSDPASSNESDNDAAQRPQFRVPHILETAQSFQKDKADDASGGRYENHVSPMKQRKKSLNITLTGEAASAKRLKDGSEIKSKNVPVDEDVSEKSIGKEKNRKKVTNGTPSQQDHGSDGDKAKRKVGKAKRKEKSLQREEKASSETSNGVQSSQSKALGIGSSS